MLSSEHEKLLEKKHEAAGDVNEAAIKRDGVDNGADGHRAVVAETAAAVSV